MEERRSRKLNREGRRRYHENPEESYDYAPDERASETSSRRLRSRRRSADQGYDSFDSAQYRISGESSNRSDHRSSVSGSRISGSGYGNSASKSSSEKNAGAGSSGSSENSSTGGGFGKFAALLLVFIIGIFCGFLLKSVVGSKAEIFTGSITTEETAAIEESTVDEDVDDLPHEAVDRLENIKEALADGNSILRTLRENYPDDIILAKDDGYVFEPINNDLKKHSYKTENMTVNDDGTYTYTEDGKVISHKGIDVSAHQGEIDWEKVVKAQLDLEFAVIRALYRGYGSGKLVEDEQFKANLEGAKSAGLKTGAYIFTQAVSESEVDEELAMFQELMQGMSMDGPLVIDVEDIPDEDGRMDKLSVEERTEIVRYYCDKVKELGYTPMLYFNIEGGVTMIDLTQFEDIEKWFASYSTEFYYPYEYSILQYSDTGSIDGIDSHVDFDILFEKEPDQASQKLIKFSSDELSGELSGKTSKYTEGERCLFIPGTENTDKTEVTLSFAGDVLFDSSYAVMASLIQRTGGSPDIAKAFDEDLLNLMHDADIFMLNNEFPYSDGGEPKEGKTYTFRASPKYASLLKDLGADIVSVGNNHVNDYGLTAMNDTFETLENINMPYVGAGRNLEDASAAWYFTNGDIKIGFLSATQIERLPNPDTVGATENSAGVFRCLNPDRLCEKIKETKEQCDFVVVYIHWGTEGTENLDHYQLEQSELIADAGADLIVGDHPHVLQKLDYVHGVPVIYSLGNYWFNSKALDTGLFTVSLDSETAELKSVQFVPARQEGCRTKLLSGSEKERVLNYMQSISGGVSIDSEGFVTPKAS